ncbi:MAG: deoxyguanosinetriphosphate triphosphohydrolase [Clostridia bacterium]|nr:deoxyguanosinetriphosphate triphosphohydrolase [Clostridia bacterium]
MGANLKIKENIFKKEREYFSKYACFSDSTKGRLREEEPCSMRTEFQRDRDRIIYSKAFLRLKNKTQVFFSPEGDHYMTRLTHTLEVTQIARSISRVLGLNEDLTEAIALGHDLGHTPFGHSGERLLDKLSPNGFRHNEQSLRVVDVLENDGKGLNLTFEVRDGILNHKLSGNPKTLEGQVVSISDRIAYLNHDVEDALRAGLITIDGMPSSVIKHLGKTSTERINSMINAVYNESYNKDKVTVNGEISNVLTEFREFMFEKVYNTDAARGEEEKAYKMLTSIYEYFMANESKLPTPYKKLLDTYSKEQVICDYISGMTDRYAVSIMKSIFIPENF